MPALATVHPRSSLDRVLEDLGTTLIELVCGDPQATDNVGGVVIHDPIDEQTLPHRALVLGVGVGSSQEIAELLIDLGRQGASALVVRAPVILTPQIEAAVAQSGTVLLGLMRGASWTQVAAMLRSRLAEDDMSKAEPEGASSAPSGDLFSLANAVAALLDAPVTIEDRSSRILAFSGRQDEADRSRVETILGRRVPEHLTRLLEDRGIFQALYRSEQPVYVEPLDTGSNDSKLARVALALRAGDEILGSIWAAVQTPLSPDRSRSFCDAGKLIAQHMLHLRADADIERRLRSDLVSAALEGTPRSPDALRQLRLLDQSNIVLALALQHSAKPDSSGAAHAHLVAELQRIADAFAVHLSSVHQSAVCAVIGEVAYGIMPVLRRRPDSEERAARVAVDFLDRIGDRAHILVGVGPVALDSTGLPRSRADAERALRVMQVDGASRRVARMADVQVDALLLELGDMVHVRGEPLTGAVARLVAYDAKHHASLVKTLRAWLEAFGDVIEASAAMYVHPNTFRYRLRRLVEVGDIDLTDAKSRFAAMLQLRLWPQEEGQAEDEQVIHAGLEDEAISASIQPVDPSRRPLR
ncbi:PucR family transcriptional regulator [Streptomyces mirabilis]|uniref:PucR family transcriptional regulator n=1 Tax=Streptomyces mirabilis TaxID=68239 RepID=UPI0037F6D381